MSPPNEHFVVPKSAMDSYFYSRVSSAFIAAGLLVLGGAAYGQGLKYERWNNLGSSLSVDILKSDGIASRSADVVSTTTSATAPSNVANNYGARLSGYVTAPVTGDYTFYVQGDDQFELWVSPDDTPFAKRREAWGTGWANTWNKFATQLSKTRRLMAGQRYYVEALVKEAAGGDYLSIGWSYEPVVSMTPSAIGSNVTQTWSESNGTISVSAEGGDIWGTADRCGFYNRAWTGDGEVIARVTGLNNPHGWAKVGVMIRTTLDANSAQATMVCTPEQGVAFQRRKTAGASSANSQAWEEFQWVKLVRKGEAITGYASVNGEEWLQIGTDTFPGLPQTVYVGLAASDVGTGTNPVIATVTDYAVRPFVASEVIPGSVLTPYAGHVDDANGNHLPDVWENQQAIQGNAFAKSQYGDPDGDRVSNLQEYQTGNAATVAQGIPGALFAERWLNVGKTSVEELVVEDKFFGPADQTSIAKTNTFRGFYVYDGVRLRGQITAPESGDYTFWVSSAGSSELWLSSNDSKFQKRRIANMSPVVGTGHGIYSISSNRWDAYASQMSEPVTLQAGQTYFIEVLVQTGHTGWDHASIAWARPGKGREAIPLSYLTSYVAAAADADDDSLPDAWESQYGLSATDNGLVERSRQGQRGDFDMDGLSNHEEYLLGTNPANADTDGDGRNDADEARSLGTDPLQSDAPGQTLVGTVNLGSYVIADHGWTVLEGGLLPHVFRGSIEWDIDVPDYGTWIIEVTTRARGKLTTEEIIPVEAAIDGLKIAREDLHYGVSAKALFRVLTPHLQPGTHRFRLFIDNLIARRTVQIESIKIYQPSGVDYDEDNVPDWLGSQLANANNVYPHDATSRTSPAFIEGKVRIFAPLFELAAEGEPVSPQRGLNNQHWYANIPLQPNETTDYAVSYGEAWNTEGTIEWEATNVLSNEILRIRKGDSLKIAASNGDSSATAQVNVFSDMRAWWKLDETYGTAADDTTGRDQDGTLVNAPLWDAGLSGNALSLNGTNQYVQVSPLNLSTNTATISAWVKRNGTQITWAGIAYTSVGGPSGIMFGANNQLRYNWNNLSYNFSSGLIVPDNQWTFCAVVVEPSKATLYMQPLGGAMQTSVNSIAHTAAPFSGNFYLGLDTNGPGRYFKGLLDDVRVYTRALNASEVGQVAAAQAAGSGFAQVLTGDQFFVQTFNQPGVFTVGATHSSGSSGMLRVEVKQANFGAPVDMPGNRLKTWNLAAANVSPDLFFEAGDGLRCTKLSTSTANQTQLRLYPEAGGALPVLARLWQGGPVVGRGEVNSILLSDSLQNQMTTVNRSTYPGYVIIRSPIGITNLPPGGKIVVVIQREGVTFLDGTTRKEFTAQELANGLVNLEVLFPEDQSGGYCHYIEIYDRNGVLVGTR